MSVDEHGRDGAQPRKGDERCTAPHPAASFLYALPAFALVIVAIVVLWSLFF